MAQKQPEASVRAEADDRNVPENEKSGMNTEIPMSVCLMLTMSAARMPECGALLQPGQGRCRFVSGKTAGRSPRRENAILRGVGGRRVAPACFVSQNMAGRGSDPGRNRSHSRSMKNPGINAARHLPEICRDLFDHVRILLTNEKKHLCFVTAPPKAHAQTLYIIYP